MLGIGEETELHERESAFIFDDCEEKVYSLNEQQIEGEFNGMWLQSISGFVIWN